MSISIEELLTLTRNHSSEVRAMLLHLDSTLHSTAEGHVEDCGHMVARMQAMLVEAKDKLVEMHTALGDLE